MYRSSLTTSHPRYEGRTFKYFTFQFQHVLKLKELCNSFKWLHQEHTVLVSPLILSSIYTLNDISFTYIYYISHVIYKINQSLILWNHRVSVDGVCSYYCLNPLCTRKDDQIEYEFDSTGIFHWCPARPFTDVLVSRWEKIILCQKTYMEITK